MIMVVKVIVRDCIVGRVMITMRVEIIFVIIISVIVFAVKVAVRAVIVFRVRFFRTVAVAGVS
jgi:hypothetical protein